MERQGFDPGTAGAGARREYERRRANRERRTLERHPRIGRLLLRLQETPQHEKAWETGAVGEEEVAQAIANRCPGVIALHDRRIPGERANIDHIAVAPSGVHVIDAKRYRGRIRVERPLFGREKLVISGRDKTKLVEGLAWQTELVTELVGRIAPDVPVSGCFCFINPEGALSSSDLPLFRTLTVAGYPLLYPRKLAKRLNATGDLTGERQKVVAEALADHFRPA